jgi:NADH-quinone oxidoreductase subunit A
MADLVFYLLVFVAVGSFFLFVHMLLGKMIRPSIPEDDKLTIYECGEPTVGSAWIQFDLRYYVVALLFVVFDVEVAFFFPWAVVFGTANRVEEKSGAEQTALIAQLQPTKAFPAVDAADNGTLDAAGAKSWAWVAFFDILVFFGVLMVGFAYLWKRGDIDWVRAVPIAAASGPAELPIRAEKVAV